MPEKTKKRPRCLRWLGTVLNGGRGGREGEGRGKKRALRGGRHPQGSDYYSFFVAPQEKLKSAGKKIGFCKNKRKENSYLLCIAACAAASLAIGTRKGEQDT